MAFSVGRIALALVAVCSQAAACSVCVLVNESFTVPHEHAVRIAIATRAAIDDGRLGNATIESADEFEANLIRVASLLADAQPRRTLQSIDVLLVDESVLYQVTVRGLQSRVARIDAKDHTAGDIRIVTTAPVVSAISRFEVRIVEAEERGLIEVESIQPD